MSSLKLANTFVSQRLAVDRFNENNSYAFGFNCDT